MLSFLNKKKLCFEKLYGIEIKLRVQFINFASEFEWGNECNFCARQTRFFSHSTIKLIRVKKMKFVCANFELDSIWKCSCDIDASRLWISHFSILAYDYMNDIEFFFLLLLSKCSNKKRHKTIALLNQTANIDRDREKNTCAHFIQFDEYHKP